MTTSSDDDRLLAAVADARRRFGDGVLTDPSRLALLLNDAAPDLRARVPALVAALDMGAAEQLRGAQDPGRARQLLAAIASRTGSDEARAALGLDLALRIAGAAGPAGAAWAPPPPPRRPEADWIGVSQPAAGPGPGASAGFPQVGASPPNSRNKWVFAGVAAVAAVVLARATGLVELREAPAPQSPPAAGPQGGPVADPRGGPGGRRPPDQAATPMLTKDLKHLPTVPVQTGPAGAQLAFAVPIPDGRLAGAVSLAGSESWDRVQVTFARPGAAPGTVSSEAAFKLVNDGGEAIRGTILRWTRDELSAGPVCITFSQRNASDVQLHGSLLCLWDNSDGKCAQPIGCGSVG